MIADLITYLTQDVAAVSTLVGTRVYAKQLPQKPTLPAITWDDVGSVWNRDMTGPAGKVRRRISLNAWASTERGAQELADAIRQGLDGFDGDMRNTVVGNIRIDLRLNNFEEEAGVTGLYRVMQDFIIAYLEV